MKTIKAWFMQPTTIGGFGGLIYIGASYAMGTMPLAKALPALAGAIFMICVKDNTQDAAHVADMTTEIEKLTGDATKR